MKLDPDLMVLQEVRDLLSKASEVQKIFGHFSQEKTDAVVAAMARTALDNAEELARLAVDETGFGRVEDKIIKNRFATHNIYESIRNMKTAGLIKEDPGKKVYEIAVPMGVVAGIIPSTNPTSTTINKVLISIKSRNAIVLSPHPAAIKCIRKTADLMHQAAVKAGAPEGIISCLQQPTMEATQELMQHKRTSVILATGGHGLVKAAYSSGKPAFGVGPGNVPAFIERSADPDAAVKMVVAGKCFDNGTVCASEQAVVVDCSLEDAVRKAFLRYGAYFCNPVEKEKLDLFMVPDGRLNVDVVGKDASVIAKMAGFSVPADTTALIVELQKVGPEAPLSLEKLSPVLAFYLVDGWLEGCEKCMEILNYGGLGHTMTIHSSDQDIIMKFALEKPAFRILANTSGTHGAIGLATGLTPSMTLGCGTWGNNITTDNITATHLINIKRLAYGTQPISFPRGDTEETTGKEDAMPQVPDRGLIRKLVRDAMVECEQDEKPDHTEKYEL